MLNIPAAPRALRWGSFILGGVVLLWLSIEDTAVTSVTALGTASALYISTLQLWQRIGGRALPMRYLLMGAPLFGTGVGIFSVICVVALMFLKTAMHSHIFPDYPPLQMIAMLERIPAWAAAGGLIGLGMALIVRGLGTQGLERDI